MAGRRDEGGTSARQDVIHRLYDLPFEDQAEVYRLLGSWVTADESDANRANPIDQQIAERLRALDDLKKAAEWFELEEG